MVIYFFFQFWATVISTELKWEITWLLSNCLKVYKAKSSLGDLNCFLYQKIKSSLYTNYTLC